jgi:thiamine biosynthesis lipoprotein
MYDVTLGAFDVSIGTGLEALDLDPETHTVQARRQGIQLDLGGIGKGYALDRVAEVLAEWDVHDALLHGGFSSVLALEPPPGLEGWPLTLSAPGGGEVLVRLSARRRAFSASGTRKREHIRDPRTGRAVAGRAAWVSVPCGSTAGGSPAAVAEALSTACMILREDQIRDLCRDGPGLDAWLLREPSTDGAKPTFAQMTGGAGASLNHKTLVAPKEE